MKKRIDLTGRQFGDLTVLGKAETKQKGRFWNAKCVCGNELVVKQSDLKNQVVTNCGHEEETAVKEVKKAAPKKAKAPAAESIAAYGSR